MAWPRAVSQVLEALLEEQAERVAEAQEALLLAGRVARAGAEVVQAGRVARRSRIVQEVEGEGEKEGEAPAPMDVRVGEEEAQVVRSFLSEQAVVVVALEEAEVGQSAREV